MVRLGELKWVFCVYVLFLDGELFCCLFVLFLIYSSRTKVYELVVLRGGNLYEIVEHDVRQGFKALYREIC